MDPEKIVLDFRADLELRQLRAHTTINYISDVKTFLRQNPDPRKVRKAELQTFLHILLDKNLADSTIKSYFISLNAFYEFLMYEGYVRDNPIPAFRKRYIPRRIHKEKRQDINIDQARHILKRMGHILDLTMHTFFAKTGVRREELIEIRIDDLKLHKWEIRGPITGKRIDERPLFIDLEMMDLLLDYLDWRDEYATSDYLFVGKTTGNRLHKDYPGQSLRRIGTQLGIHKPDGHLDERLTPHVWRRFFTTAMHRAHMDPEHIKYLRGDVMEREAWQIYLAIDPEEVRHEYLEKVPQLFTYPHHHH